MTRTEDRLRDALGAAARTVPDTVPPPNWNAAPKPAGPAWRWPLVAVATATALALVVGLPAVLLSDGDGDGELRPASMLPSTIPAADQPPYYVSSEPERYRAHVRDSRTGEQIDTLPGKGYSFVASAPDQRTFYLVRYRPATQESTIIRLVLRADGQVASAEPVPDTTTDKGYAGIAVSPDGERLAFTHTNYANLGVLDLETGEQRIWPADGVDMDMLSTPSWLPDGRSVTFLMADSDTIGLAPYAGQLRVLNVYEDDDLMDSRAVTGSTVPVPGFGTGYLIDTVVSADGKRAFAVFGQTKEQDQSAYPQGSSKALVEVSLRTGEITVVDDDLVGKHVGEIGVDASRRHVLVFAGNHQDNTDGEWGAGVYDRESGKVRWLEESEPPDSLGW